MIVPEIRSWEGNAVNRLNYRVDMCLPYLFEVLLCSYKSSSIRMDSVIHLDLGDAAAPDS
jgi:hypothetical protein